MANRYWVGGSGTWDTTSTTHWSTSSGGLSGASAPTTSDSVFFDQAGTYTVTMGSSIGLYCLDWNVTAGVVTFSGTPESFRINGSINLIAGTVCSFTPVNFVYLAGASNTIQTNGVAFPNVTFAQGTVGTTNYTLSGALTCSRFYIGSSGSATLGLNGYTLTTTNSGVGVAFSSGVLNFGTNGTLSITNGGYMSVSGPVTVSGSGTIGLSGSANLFIDYGSNNFSNITLAKVGTGSLRISTAGTSSTFGTITNTSSPATFSFDPSTSVIVSNFSVSGTPGNLVYINSNGGTFYLNKSGGVVSCDYLSIQDSHAAGGATWYAGANSVNVSNNTGWIFSAAPPSAGFFLIL